ncbi:MAG: DUF2155 domain-containing protein [Rickettsiales bacterium]|nr:DUF2155 domain-containing protein [Rickettsiales bacterium]
MNKIIFIFLIFLLTNKAAFSKEEYTQATVRLLDKITAKSSLVDIDLKKPYNYGNLNIIIYKCWNSPLDQKPETKMLLRVLESKDEKEDALFFGWIFASSPSISSIQHPIYDITAIKCK